MGRKGLFGGGIGAVILTLVALYFRVDLGVVHADKARQVLDPGDVEEALAAAAGVGDDRLQKQTRGYVVPDSFTHGSSAQRMLWFQRGLQGGDPARCDTFKA